MIAHLYGEQLLDWLNTLPTDAIRRAIDQISRTSGELLRKPSLRTEACTRWNLRCSEGRQRLDLRHSHIWVMMDHRQLDYRAPPRATATARYRPIETPNGQGPIYAPR